MVFVALADQAVNGGEILERRGGVKLEHDAQVGGVRWDGRYGAADG